jgi:fructose-1,6-bisphosphatase-3
MWFLWCGKNSPLCGRQRITTFERLLIDDETAWTEPKNAYYSYLNEEVVIDNILKEFGLYNALDDKIHSHIIVQIYAK